MLFMLNGIAKLKDTGRMAIIQNGSSLFTGDAGSGQSEIRRYIIENDWLDAIVQLPNDSFYNTGIATYVWLITKDKPVSHREHVLLIDASGCFEQRRKPIGNKRVDITETCRNLIIEAYGDYDSKTYEKNAPKYIMMPGNAKKRHPIVEQRTVNLVKWAETCAINRLEEGEDKSMGIVTSSTSYQYVK